MKPIVSAGRVVGLDIARALALVGMMATHILPSFDVDGLTLSQQVAGGRASALFAVLAGVSIALMSGRTSPQQGRTRWATAAGLAARALLIAVIGLFLAEADSGIAVILTYYGVLFLLAVPFLGLRARALAVLAAVWVVAVPIASHLVRPHLPPPSYDSPSFAGLADPWQLLTELTLTGYYPAVPWLAYVLAGMAVGRTTLGPWRTTAGVGVVGMTLAVTAWAVSEALLTMPGARRALITTFTGPGAQETMDLTLARGLYGTTPTGSWWWLAVHAPHTATPFDLAHTIGTSLLVIAVAVALGRLAPAVLAVAFGAGAMTLTLYSAHVLLRSEGWWDGDDMGTFVGQVLLVLLVGAAFKLTRSRGPLEAGVAKVQAAVRRAAGPRPRR
ncbi:MAG TPA: heparan-alpha-glucosaminide N-acetyltransferase domain-containing protein [Nocardioidaceae bacterium]|nr:heparan-alpha-glucosaminide N-acetyltransferase domain-containing protein [Nocardioidaceae bacterium]